MARAVVGAGLAPGLGLRVPDNLFTALLGGVIIGASVFLISREK